MTPSYFYLPPTRNRDPGTPWGLAIIGRGFLVLLELLVGGGQLDGTMGQASASAQPLLRKRAKVRLWPDHHAEKPAESETLRACMSTHTQAVVHTVRYDSSGVRHYDI